MDEKKIAIKSRKLDASHILMFTIICQSMQSNGIAKAVEKLIECLPSFDSMGEVDFQATSIRDNTLVDMPKLMQRTKVKGCNIVTEHFLK